METVFIPNGRRYLVLKDKDEGGTTEYHGMKLTTEAERHKKPTKGTVIAVGDGDSGDDLLLYGMRYKVGARLVFGKFAGVDYENDKGQDCVILAEAEILGEEAPLPLTNVLGETITPDPTVIPVYNVHKPQPYSDREKREDLRSVAAEAYWKEKQGDEYGSY